MDVYAILLWDYFKDVLKMKPEMCVRIGCFLVHQLHYANVSTALVHWAQDGHGAKPSQGLPRIQAEHLLWRDDRKNRRRRTLHQLCNYILINFKSRKNIKRAIII